ncbi:HEAT repeat domain-containing protein [Pedobacter caeni]|uniref:HEAT repeat-containing protein n=1 Tax=Pedobacter caeni TaxID=288992 RepID=A0A1M5KLT7_9SPHI|nr:HEAT repeat domain-containing protein [Pedobacter caeni]SHG53675.1 hypothetical protein SAMN04488522_1067 [Pedobacter caeni]
MEKDQGINETDYIMEQELQAFEKEKEHLENLFSPDPELRQKTAAYFSKFARNSGNKFRGFFFSHPKTFEILIPALKDPDPKVVISMIQTLGCAYNRYHEDSGVQKALYELFDHADKDVLYATLIWTRFFENEERFKYIFSLLEKKQSKKMLMVLSDQFGKTDSTAIKIKAQPLLMDCYHRKIDAITRKAIVRALGRTLDESTIPEFINLIDLKAETEFSELMKEQILMYEPQERIDYLIKELWGH